MAWVEVPAGGVGGDRYSIGRPATEDTNCGGRRLESDDEDDEPSPRRRETMTVLSVQLFAMVTKAPCMCANASRRG